MKTILNAKKINLLADLQTPVSLYMKVRDLYPQSAMLESSDYHSSYNSFSFIGLDPIAKFSLEDGMATMTYPHGKRAVKVINSPEQLTDTLNDYIKSFEVRGDNNGDNGFFGYTSYDSVKYFENIDVQVDSHDQLALPDMVYILYRFVIAVNHYRNEMNITENTLEGEQSKLEELMSVLNSRNYPTYNFSIEGQTTSPIEDKTYMDMVSEGIKHCHRGDVFQIVLSRRYEQKYTGDDFKVYRALRSINPSPYLFYFDFGSYRVFGSSPETHVKIQNNVATIDPIAGTFHRTGDDEKDRELARKLLADPKENAEHVMLVDLARNDLSRNATNVEVEYYKDIQFYSHVIHMVSRVSGRISPDVNRMKVFADTFPAGTLSGAPKVKAMQLINNIETHHRGIYGGCIGHIGFDGNLNQAITIRTFVSRNNTLYFQAGAGIVAKSNPENELNEVKNKLGALRRAIEIANELKN